MTTCISLGERREGRVEALSTRPGTRTPGFPLIGPGTEPHAQTWRPLRELGPRHQPNQVGLNLQPDWSLRQRSLARYKRTPLFVRPPSAPLTQSDESHPPPFATHTVVAGLYLNPLRTQSSHNTGAKSAGLQDSSPSLPARPSSTHTRSASYRVCCSHRSRHPRGVVKHYGCPDSVDY